jgi:SpoU rRNA methylase family enzyme
MEYVIRCTVSSGVTGYREGILKRNDAVVVFDDLDGAIEEAPRLQNKRNSNPYRKID